MRRHLTNPRRHAAAGLLSLLAALLAGGLGGCDRGSRPLSGSASDLLGRRPDAVFDQPGILVPHETAQWGVLGLSGWRLETLKAAEGLAYVETLQPVAVLKLPVVEPGERTLALTLWCPEPHPDAEPRASIRLNGVEIDSRVLGSSPEVLRITTPAQLWLESEANLLEIEAVRSAQRTWSRLALARVEYGAERRAQLDARESRAELSPGTGMRYLVEPPRRAQLVIHGLTDGVGELEIALDALDPRTGISRDEDYPRGTITAARVEEGTRIDLPRRVEGLLQIDIRWRAAGSASLALDRLEVVAEDELVRPPVVFLSIDTLSASHMSVYGYGRATTPRLEALAEESVVFERCIANAPWTMPSYLSVMTGLFPEAHRMDLETGPGMNIQWAAWDSWQIADNRWTIAEMLRAKGYRTAGYIDSHWLMDKFRMDQGFDLYNTEAMHLSILEPLGGIHLIHIVSQRWLDTLEPGDPYFLFVHALDAHGPFIPGEPFDGQFEAGPPPGGWTLVKAGSAMQTHQALPEWMARTSVPDPGVEVAAELPLEPVIRKYDETILKTDEYIGKILDELRGRGLYEEAMVIISADHGESFGHDFFGHGAMWEDVVHVPLIIKMPHGRFGGTRVAQSVQLVDLYPTILDVLDGEPRDYLHGRSLQPLMRGEELPEVPLYSSGGHCEQYLLSLGEWKLVRRHPSRQSDDVTVLSHPLVPREWLEEHAPELLDVPLTDARYRAFMNRGDSGELLAELRGMLDGPYTALYRVSEDRDERRNLVESRPKRAEELRRALERVMELAEEARSDARPVPTGTPFSEEALEELGKLGYVNSPK